MNNISISTNDVWVCESYFNKISEHLELMNLWKCDPNFAKSYPFLADKEFTLEDSLKDLLMKGLL